MIHYPIQLEKIFNKLKKYSIKPIIVGGFIRDAFLKIESKDIDIELYNINSLDEIEEILKEFGEVNSVGKSFGVVKLLYNDLDLDFSLPRTDNKQAKGHKGFHIKVDTSLTFKEASRRRDFTINSMGYDVFEKKILDPYKGREDLKNKILKAVDLTTFNEDPLRVLRAVVFSTRFDLKLQKDLFKNAKIMIEEGALNELPKERIFQEIQKLLLKTNKPSKGLYLLKELSGFVFFDEFNSLNSKELQEIFNALDRSIFTTSGKKEKEKLIIMLALLTSKFSQKLQKSFLDKLTNEKELLKSVMEITKLKFDLQQISNYSIYKLATLVDISLYISYLLALHPNNEKDIKLLELQAKKLNVYTESLKPLTEGKDLISLGLKPSKNFGKILQDIYDMQMKEIFTTKEEALLIVKKNYLL